MEPLEQIPQVAAAVVRVEPQEQRPILPEVELVVYMVGVGVEVMIPTRPDPLVEVEQFVFFGVSIENFLQLLCINLWRTNLCFTGQRTRCEIRAKL
jgi:hypothetical protein